MTVSLHRLELGLAPCSRRFHAQLVRTLNIKIAHTPVGNNFASGNLMDQQLNWRLPPRLYRCIIAHISLPPMTKHGITSPLPKLKLD